MKIDLNKIVTTREINIDYLPISKTLENYLRDQDHYFAFDEFCIGDFYRRIISIDSLQFFLTDNPKAQYFKSLKRLYSNCRELKIDQIIIE